MYQSDMYQRDMYRTTESDVRARRHSNKERPGEKGAEGGPPKLTHPQLGSTARGSRVPLSRFEGLTNTLGGVKSRLGPDPYRRPPFNLKREKFMAHRRLLDGSRVNEELHVRPLTITTKVPNKWAAVDLETGQIWVPRPNGGWDAADDGVKNLVTAAASGQRPAAPRQATPSVNARKSVSA